MKRYETTFQRRHLDNHLKRDCQGKLMEYFISYAMLFKGRNDKDY
jgi:hypothetical protein